MTVPVDYGWVVVDNQMGVDDYSFEQLKLGISDLLVLACHHCLMYTHEVEYLQQSIHD